MKPTESLLTCCTPKFASFTWPRSIPIVSPEGMLMTIAASKWRGSSLSFAVFAICSLGLCGALTRPEVVTTGSCYDRKLPRWTLTPVGCLESVNWTVVLDWNTGLEYRNGLNWQLWVVLHVPFLRLHHALHHVLLPREPGEPVEPVEPGEPWEPREPREPEEPGEPVELVKPVKYS